MSEIKVNSIKGVAASTAAITVNNSDGTCTANLTNRTNKRLTINGAMTVAQRGSSSTDSGYGSVDRMNITFAGHDEAPTQAQVDVASGTTPYSLGFRKALRITNGNQTSGAGATDYIQFRHSLESQDIATSGWNYTSTSSFITLTFYVKSSVAQNFYGTLRTRDGTLYAYPFETGSLSADTWTKVTKTVPGAASLQFDNDNGVGFDIFLWPFRGTDYKGSAATLNQWQNWASSAAVPDMTSTWYTTNDSTFEITGLQLEVGDHATDFEHLPYAEEFRRCARYCYQWGADQMLGFGQVWSGSGYIKIFPPIPVNMRAKPSISKSTGTGSVWFVSYQGNSGYAGDRTVTVEGNLMDYNPHTSTNVFRIFVHNGSNQGNGTTVMNWMHDTTGCYMRLDAEL